MTAIVTVYFNGAPVDVTAFVRSVSIRRGRSRELDRFSTGTATVVFNNEDRRFDPLYSAGPYSVRSGHGCGCRWCVMRLVSLMG